MPEDHSAIGEVIESNTSVFVADVLRGAETPAFGSWVRVKGGAGGMLLAVVCQVEQGSVMPRRRAMAFGKTNDELQREMPQVMALMQTSFKALLVAHRLPDGRMRQTLPSHPAQIHQFVELCPDADIRNIVAPYDILRILLGQAELPVSIDDLLVAVLRHMHDAAPPDSQRKLLLEAGKSLSRLMRDDHERLQAVLRRIQ